MKLIFAIPALVFCASACMAASIDCGSIGPNGVPVTSSLVVFCGGNRFDFGTGEKRRKL